MRSKITLGALCAVALACAPEVTLDDGLDSGGTGGSAAGNAGTAGAAPAGAGGNAEAGAGGATAGSPTAGGGGSQNPSECPGELPLSDGSDLNEEAWPPEGECSTVPTPPAPASLAVAPLAGTWVDDGMEPRVEVVLDATGAGTLLYGEFAELPPITDPDEPYLIDVGANDMAAFDRANMQLGYRMPREGFRYSVLPDRGASSEMVFFIATTEPWSDWCAQQEPVRGANCYQCEFVGDGGTLFLRDACSVPDGCYAIVANELLPVHCGRTLLCGLTQACTCDADECFAESVYSRKQLSVTLDPLDPDVLRLVGENGEARYLRRQQP
jgi:hypothetical protein